MSRERLPLGATPHRDALQAAQLRCGSLEARVVEREAELEAARAGLRARDAELCELRDLAGRSPRRRRGWLVGLGGLLLGTVVSAAIAGYAEARLDDEAAWRRASERRAAEAEQAARDERYRAADLARELEAARAQRRPGAAPKNPFQLEPILEHGDQGQLMAIAIGGTCRFRLDGEDAGRASSLRRRVVPGNHVVSCMDDAGAVRTQRVTVELDKPGIASFKL